MKYFLYFNINKGNLTRCDCTHQLNQEWYHYEIRSPPHLKQAHIPRLQLTLEYQSTTCVVDRALEVALMEAEMTTITGHLASPLSHQNAK